MEIVWRTPIGDLQAAHVAKARSTGNSYTRPKDDRDVQRHDSAIDFWKAQGVVHAN